MASRQVVCTGREWGAIDLILVVSVQPHIYGIVPSPVLVASRHVVGTGREWGAIVTTLRNSGPLPLTVSSLDSIPWFLRLYLHTLR